MRTASASSALTRGPWVHALQIIAKFARFAVYSAGCFLTLVLIFVPTAAGQTGTPSFQILVNPAAFRGRTLTVKYKGGEKKIIVPPDAPVVSYVPGDKSELKPGVKIFTAAATAKPDGTLEAARVNYGKDGLTPPM